MKVFDGKNKSKLVLTSKARNKFLCAHDTKHAKGKESNAGFVFEPFLFQGLPHKLCTNSQASRDIVLCLYKW